MNEKKEYKSYKIPLKKPLRQDSSISAEKPGAGLSEKVDPFAYIEIAGGAEILKTQSVPPHPAGDSTADELRRKFAQLRLIARNHSDPAKIFCNQALFMRDFEDDYEYTALFSAYFPCYQMMNNEQLRTYFTWRSKVRQKDICDIPVSYAFIYIYELLNNIGTENPGDGLEKLLAFWRAFREFSPVTDKYVLKWIKDYYIYYGLSESLDNFILEYSITEYFPVLKEKSDESDFELYRGLSKYNIEKSVFYREENKKLICDCFNFVILKLKEIFAAAELEFEDFVFKPFNSYWEPFGDALFFSRTKQPDRIVRISEREIYFCRNSNWYRNSFTVTETSRQLAGYILKQTESALRKVKGFKHKLTADPNIIKGAVLLKLNVREISIERTINEAVAEFWYELNKTVVSVNILNLEKIRREALQTQEKLIVTDPELKNETSPLSEPEIPVIEKAGETSPAGEWIVFRHTLTESEHNGLKIILSHGDIKAFADSRGLMLEVLIDNLNQKAFDAIGDNIIELDGQITVYDEYRENLTETVK